MYMTRALLQCNYFAFGVGGLLRLSAELLADGSAAGCQPSRQLEPLYSRQQVSGGIEILDGGRRCKTDVREHRTESGHQRLRVRSGDDELNVDDRASPRREELRCAEGIELAGIARVHVDVPIVG